MSNSVKLLLIVVVLVGAWAGLSMLESPAERDDGCGSDHSAGGG